MFISLSPFTNNGDIWCKHLTTNHVNKDILLCFVQDLRNASNVILSCWLWVFWDQKRLWMNLKPSLTPGVIWRSPRTSIPPVFPMCMQHEVRVQMLVKVISVAKLNVYVLNMLELPIMYLSWLTWAKGWNELFWSNTCLCLYWAVLIKYLSLSILSIVINVLWDHTMCQNQRILPLTGTITFWVKDDKVCSIKRLFSSAVMTLVIQLMW